MVPAGVAGRERRAQNPAGDFEARYNENALSSERRWKRNLVSRIVLRLDFCVPGYITHIHISFSARFFFFRPAH